MSLCLLGTVVAVVAFGQTAAASATGDDRADLGAVKETTEVLGGTELASDEFPGSWPMFGTDTRMKIGGYVKTDLVSDLDGTLDQTQFLMSTIPVEGTAALGNGSGRQRRAEKKESPMR